MRSIISAFLCAALIGTACGSDSSPATSARSTTLENVTNYDEAVVAARDVVDTTVTRFLAGLETEEDGLGEHGCDVPNVRLYDYGIAAPVESPEEAVRLVGEIWQFWQIEYGFKKQGGPPVNDSTRSLSAKSRDFWGSLTANVERSVLYIGVSTPCFER